MSLRTDIAEFTALTFIVVIFIFLMAYAIYSYSKAIEIIGGSLKNSDIVSFVLFTGYAIIILLALAFIGILIVSLSLGCL